MGDVYIYCLIDPRTDEIRYIGKTINLRQRYSHHIGGASSGNKAYCKRWIRKLSLSGLKPTMLTLEIVNENNWEEKEIWWIAFGRKYWRLTNISDGGFDGHLQTPEQKQKNSIVRQKRIYTLETRLKTSGEKSVNAKLISKEVNEIRQAYFSGGITQQELADIYGVRVLNISRIIRYKTWKHVETPLTIKQKINRIRFCKPNKAGKNNPKAKLSYYKADQIRELYSRGGYSYDKLGKMYSVDKSTIAGIINRKAWIR